MSSKVITPQSEHMNAQAMIKRERILRIIKHIILYSFLIIMAFFVIVPFYWMFLVSLKTSAELEAPIQSLFTAHPQWINYKNALSTTEFNYGRLLYNTIYVGVLSTIGSLITTILAAFAFARIKFKGSNLMFSLFMATMMIPGEMMTITNYKTVVADLKWGNTYTALIVPFIVSVFYIYLLRQTFKQIPDELYYAAKVDGTGDFKYLLKIMIPIAMPTIITITILKLMGSWNSYVWPNLVANKLEMRLITNGLRGAAFTDPETGRIAYNTQMAATVLVTVPLLLVFIFLRKYIMSGVSRSGIKG
ncbi:MAG: carbohydrate ABC transporter permease [Bacilli bacterium]|nr:carbohydrate ABC transporter permease [Bacilli bacterium]